MRLLTIPIYKCAKGSILIRFFNGKLQQGQKIKITVDSVTYRIIQSLYDFDCVTCHKIAIATSVRRLPKSLLITIAELARQKNELGKIKDESDENADNYRRVKEMLNAIYGANVQKFRNFEYHLNPTNWECIVLPYEKPKRLIRIYAVGVWITAFARESLINDGILRVGIDNFVYCDTDSVKSTEQLKITEYFDSDTINFLKSILTDDQFESIKNFGKFEQEKTSRRFMQCGAKKYFSEDENGNFKYTVAGLPKPAKALKQHGANVPESFDDIKEGKCFKNVKLSHKLINNDYTGELYEFKNGKFFRLNGKKPSGKGGTGLFPVDYTFNVTKNDALYCSDFGCPFKGDVKISTDIDDIDDDKLKYLFDYGVI